MAPSINFGIRLPIELIESADAKAEREDRTRAQVIRRALERDLERDRFGDPQPATHDRN
jgi:predicted DNA-binding protein